MEIQKRKIHTTEKKAETKVQVTLEKDVNISDLKPDGAKLILDRAQAAVEEVRTVEEHVVVKGKLNFWLLYLTDEEEPKVAKMEGELPFDEKIYLPEVDSGDEVQAEVLVEELRCSLINSRKFSIQALLLFQAECEQSSDTEAAVDLPGEEEIEFRKKDLNLASPVMKKNDIFRIRESVEIPASTPNIASLVWYDASAENVEFQGDQEKLNLSMELKLFILYQSEEGDYCHYEQNVPVSGSLACDGMTKDMILEVSHQLFMKEVSVKPDMDEEDRVVSFEGAMRLQISAFEEETISILSDVYGVTKEVEAKTVRQDLKRYLGHSNSKVRIAEKTALPESEKGAKLLLSTGHVKSLGMELTEKGLEVSGEVQFQILYQIEDTQQFDSLRLEAPFHGILEPEHIENRLSYQVRADLQQISAAIDENAVEVRAFLSLQTNWYRNLSETVILEITTGELNQDLMSSLPGMAVYTVREGESLWDIGKKYYVPIASMKEVNELQGEEIRTGDKILIVR